MLKSEITLGNIYLKSFEIQGDLKSLCTCRKYSVAKSGGRGERIYNTTDREWGVGIGVGLRDSIKFFLCGIFQSRHTAVPILHRRIFVCSV